MRAVLIYNEASGKGKVKKDFNKINAFFKLNNWVVDYYQVTKDKDLKNDCEAMSCNYDTFLIAGGDGTIHSVILGIMRVPKENRPRLLFLPYGTTNDVAGMLGLGKNVFYNLALLKTTSYEEMDVYKANDQYFIYAAAVGKFSKISYEIDRMKLRWLGPFGYVMNGFNDLFNIYKMQVRVVSSIKNYDKKSFLIMMAAGSRVAGFNMSKFTKGMKLNSGQIAVRVFTRNHFFSWTKMVWFYLFRGRHFKNDLHLNESQIRFELDERWTWNLDGERGPKGSLKVEVLNKEVTVYVHPKHRNKLFN